MKKKTGNKHIYEDDERNLPPLLSLFFLSCLFASRKKMNSSSSSSSSLEDQLRCHLCQHGDDKKEWKKKTLPTTVGEDEEEGDEIFPVSDHFVIYCATTQNFCDLNDIYVSGYENCSHAIHNYFHNQMWGRKEEENDETKQ